MSSALLEHVRELAMTLAPEVQLALIGDLAAKLLGRYEPVEKNPFRSLRGALKDLGPAPSAEEIDQARRKCWSMTPRERP